MKGGISSAARRARAAAMGGLLLAATAGCAAREERPVEATAAPETAATAPASALVRPAGVAPGVRITEKRVVLLGRVRFEAESAVLPEETQSILKDFAKVLRANDWIELVRVEVAGRDLALSTARADAVRAWLTGAGGVARARLEARGYVGTPDRVDFILVRP